VFTSDFPLYDILDSGVVVLLEMLRFLCEGIQEIHCQSLISLPAVTRTARDFSKQNFLHDNHSTCVWQYLPVREGTLFKPF
jgi:hypothetical protein